MIKCLQMFSCQFYEKWMPFRERNMKVLYTWKCCLHSYNRNSDLHFTTKAVMHCRNCNRDSHLHKYNKNCHPHIQCRNCHYCINAAETSNSTIANETVKCMIATKRPTNTTVTESTIGIVAIEPQNLNNCIRRFNLYKCCRGCQLHSSNRSFHL